MAQLANLHPGGENKDTIPVDLYISNKNNKTIVFIGGDGNTRNTWTKIIELIQKNNSGINCVSFSFSGREDDENYSLRQQLFDLSAVIEYLIIGKGIKDFTLFATSEGTYSTCLFIGVSKYSENIKSIIFFDPADYHLFPDFYKQSDYIWNGPNKFNPKGNLASDFLPVISPKTKVHVIRLTLRNYGKQGYLVKDNKSRDLDNPNGYPRLNTEMVKGFYAKTPNASRGKYIEQPDIPHAINRDGNIEKNNQTVAKLLLKLL
jgi:pimeloyl-ACP methyl ester carboxylesterase